MRSTGMTMTGWRTCLAMGLLLGPVVLDGCDATRRDWRTCYTTQDCGEGRVCTTDHRCMAADAGGTMDGGPTVGSDGGTAPVSLDGGDAPAPLDGLSFLDAAATESGGGEGPNVAALDVAPDGAVSALDVGPSTALDAPIEQAMDASMDLAVDTHIPDAPGSCSADGDCMVATPFCLDDRCVACKTSEHCQGGTPICSASHACVSCALAGGGCPAASPACEAASGRCVECVNREGCTGVTKPICDSASNRCVACAADSQCAGVGPSVCMAHVDGRCATDAETIYVGSSATSACSDSAQAAGSAVVPFCSVQKGVLAARSMAKRLVVLSGPLTGGFSGVVFSSPLTVVGKNAVLTPEADGDGIGITSGELYLRGLKLAGSAATQTGIGIHAQATMGATLVLRVEHCEITGNPGGGILLAGAAFDIRDTVVSGNGPGQTEGGTSFGGIRVDSLPSVGSIRLERVTIRDNTAPGLSCSARIEGSGVLASGNGALDVTNSCGISTCTTASATCGAQP